MKPSSFAYSAPRSVDEVVHLLAQHGGDARILAGGQSLVPLMNLGLTEPKMLVDVNRVDGASGIAEWDGGVAIGALTRQAAVERSAVVSARLPLVTEAIRQVGYPAIRHRGTVGGMFAFADPAAELPAVALALEATLVARGPGGERTIPASGFFLDYLTTALEPDEMLTEIRLPGTPPRTGSAFLELARRPGDFAVCGAAALVTLDEAGRCERVRIALCGAGPTPLRAERAERALTGEMPSDEAIDTAARETATAIDPPSDVHGSAEYRRKMAVVMTRRAVALAAQRAAEGVEG